MTDITDAIFDELKNAFPAKRRRFMPLGSDGRGGEADYVDQFFADKDDWTKVEPQSIDRSPLNLSAALCFMHPEAKRFYIPTYLAADLAGKPTEEDPVFHLCHGFHNRWLSRRGGPSRGKKSPIARERFGPISARRKSRLWFTTSNGCWPANARLPEV